MKAVAWSASALLILSLANCGGVGEGDSRDLPGTVQNGAVEPSGGVGGTVQNGAVEPSGGVSDGGSNDTSSYSFRLPLPGGWSWSVNAKAGDLRLQSHQGNNFYSLDFSPSAYGPQIPVYAMHGGKVIEVFSGPPNTSVYGTNYGGFPNNGYFVRVDQDSDGNRATGLTTVYLHFSDPPLVSAGNVIAEGTVLGYMGETGEATGKHLHITLRYNDNGQDPNQEVERVKIEGLSIRDFVVGTSYLSSR